MRLFKRKQPFLRVLGGAVMLFSMSSLGIQGSADAAPVFTSHLITPIFNALEKAILKNPLSEVDGTGVRPKVSTVIEASPRADSRSMSLTSFHQAGRYRFDGKNQRWFRTEAPGPYADTGRLSKKELRNALRFIKDPKVRQSLAPIRSLFGADGETAALRQLVRQRFGVVSTGELGTQMFEPTVDAEAHFPGITERQYAAREGVMKQVTELSDQSLAALSAVAESVDLDPALPAEEASFRYRRRKGSSVYIHDSFLRPATANSAR